MQSNASYEILNDNFFGLMRRSSLAKIDKLPQNGGIDWQNIDTQWHPCFPRTLDLNNKDPDSESMSAEDTMKMITNKVMT